MGGLPIGIVKTQVASQLKSIVKRSSIIQAQKGIFSAGPIRSARYVGKKVRKMVTGRLLG